MSLAFDRSDTIAADIAAANAHNTIAAKAYVTSFKELIKQLEYVT